MPLRSARSARTALRPAASGATAADDPFESTAVLASATRVPIVESAVVSAAGAEAPA